MIDPTIPLSVDDQTPLSVGIEEETEGPNITELDDGGVEVDLGEGEDDIEELAFGHDENLADLLTDQELSSLASELISDFEADLRSRSSWEKTYQKGLDLLGLTIEDRSTPWPGACGVYHPILTEAVIRFQAQTIMEIYPASGPAKTKIMGKVDPDKLKRADRVENEMNYIITEKMPDYRAETEQLLFKLAMAGSAFRKVYYDPIADRPAAVFVPAEDFVTAYGTSDLKTSPRYTHVMRMYPNEVRQLQLDGFYRDIDLPEPTPDYTELDKKYDKLSGDAPVIDNDERHKILEMHVDLDLPGFEDEDGLLLPYIVTVEKGSRTILSIRRNWKEDDEKKIKRIHFAPYQYLPGLGFYGTGLIHLIGGIAKSATSILRQLVDAGTLSNLPAGLKARGLRIKGDDSPIMPGEFRDVDVASGNIRDSITFLPYKEPSAVLYQLLGSLVEEGRRVGSIAEIDVGESNPEAPVGTTLALLERSMKVMSAVQARVHESLGKELRLIAGVVRDYMPPEYEYDVSDDTGATYSRYDDFGNGIDIIPVSDPNASTMAQKVMQYQAALQLAQQSPEIYDLPLLHRQMLEVLNIKNADQIIKQEVDPGVMDPVTENMFALQGKGIKVYPEQDHDSHLKVHAAFMQDPKYSQFISQSPNAQAFTAAMQSHMAEHLAFSYRRALEMKVGVSLPNPGDKLPDNVENDISKLAALGAEKLSAANAQAAQQQQQQQEANDPLNIIQKKELEIKAREVAIKELTAEVDALVKANKILQEDRKIGLEEEKVGIAQRGEMVQSVKDALELIRIAGGSIPGEVDANVQPEQGAPVPQAPPPQQQ